MIAATAKLSKIMVTLYIIALPLTLNKEISPRAVLCFTMAISHMWLFKFKWIKMK